MAVAKIKRRFGLHGDVLSKFLTWGVRNTPFYLEPLIIFLYVSALFLVAKNQRRALIANISAIRGTKSIVVLWASAYRVVWNFACTIADAARTRDGEEVDWEVIGIDHVQAAAKQDSRGLIILTAHMGNYDVAAPLFGPRFEQDIYAVRAQEQSEELQEYMEGELRKSEGENFHVIYNRRDGLLAVDLMRVLSEGNAVAVQGDRVMFDVSPTTIPFGEEWELRIPKGPLTLALASNALVLPLFVVRSGRRQYSVIARQPCRFERSGRGQKEMAARAAEEEWGGLLAKVIREYWDQWFVFEKAFTKKGEGRP